MATQSEILAAMSSDLVLRAMKFGVKCHEETNHKYDGDLPYSIHLSLVFQYACKYAHLLPVESIKFVLAACWLHDCIEDARVTYNDIKKEFGFEVAELVYAVTNSKGKNRAERAGNEYYKGIIETPLASFLKICDRLANAYFSKLKGGRMLSVYAKESIEFKNHLYSIGYNEMFYELRTILTI